MTYKNILLHLNVRHRSGSAQRQMRQHGDVVAAALTRRRRMPRMLEPALLRLACRNTQACPDERQEG